MKLLANIAGKSPCEPGFWVAKGDGCEGLTLCKSGHYCPGWYEDTNKIYPCPAGTYNTRAGAVSAL